MTRNKIIFIMAIIAIGGLSAWFLIRKSKNNQVVCTQEAKICPDGSAVGRTGSNCEFAQCPMGSVQSGGYKYFGNEAKGDFNGDGFEDIAFLATQEPGGSGTFFYVIANLGSAGGYRETNAVFIGDRIAPQTTEFRNGEIIVNYAERKLSEPMTARPSVGVSKYFKIANDELTEVKK